ncbi:MAG: hypothetical protein WAK48_23245 [Candidatus Acidiferrum sp.]|jgi:hypothetical protein
MTEKFYAYIDLLQSRHMREWAKEDGIDENDAALERIVNALDRLRRGMGDNETREEYKAAQTAYRAECRAAMKAYREAHGEHSIRA